MWVSRCSGADLPPSETNSEGMWGEEWGQPLGQPGAGRQFRGGGGGTGEAEAAPLARDRWELRAMQRLLLALGRG